MTPLQDKTNKILDFTLKSGYILRLEELFRENSPVSTHPTSMKRKPKMGRMIWQLAATTTPATASPPSTRSTRNRDNAGGQRGLPPTTSGSPGGDVVLKHENIKLGIEVNYLKVTKMSNNIYFIREFKTMLSR